LAILEILLNKYHRQFKNKLQTIEFDDSLLLDFI